MGSRVCAILAAGVVMACRVQPSARQEGSVAPVRDTTSADAERLLATDREWARVSASSRNADSIVAYWTDDARVVLPGEVVLNGRAAIRAMVAGTLKIPGFRVSWMPESSTVSRSGDLGYTYGTNVFTVPDSSGHLVTTHGRYLTVWRRDAMVAGGVFKTTQRLIEADFSQDRRMRAYSAAIAAALFATGLGAQVAPFQGAWKSLGGRVVAPDTSYEIAAFTGLAVIRGRYISQTWATASPNGVRQAGELMNADVKAARYDAVVANAGTFDADGKQFVMRVSQAKEPSLVGQTLNRAYEFHGDTLFVTETFPWAKDNTKVVRSTVIFVRLPSKPQRLDGVWRHQSTDFSSPDTSYHRSAVNGLLVIHGAYYSRTFVVNSTSTHGQMQDPADAAAKAARYDALIMNAGTLEIEGDTFTQHVDEAADLETVGVASVWHYRLHGDTLFTTMTEPWPKDSTKVVRLSVNFVRVR